MLLYEINGRAAQMLIISLLFFSLPLVEHGDPEKNTFDKNRTRRDVGRRGGNSLIHEGVIFIFCLLPLSSQRGAAGGYGDGEWGQWDRHRGLLATPSRRRAEWGGPGVQGNNKTAAQQLPEVGERGTRVVRTRTKETQTVGADRLDNKDDVQAWEGN